MELLAVIVLAVVVVAIVTALGQKTGIAAPLVLVAIGLGVAVLPFVPAATIDPEWILVGVLPPLLYSSAVSLPAIEFRRDFAPIAGLSVLLVVISSLILGAFFAWVIPDLGFALGVALGAILSPTDAVATTIAARMGIAPRVVTMLRGESMLNDATALVVLRTAIAAVAGGFSLGETLLAFVWSVLGALIIGALVGYLNLRIRERIRNPAANTALSFAVPFVAYLPAEELGASGLVAAVVAGIVTGQGAARRFTPEQRMSDELNWRTIELVLEGGVFLVMGLELKEVVRSNFEEHDGLWHGIWLALVALLLIVVVRAAYVTVLLWQQGRRARRSQERFAPYRDRFDQLSSMPPPENQHPGAERRMQRFASLFATLDYYRDSALGWKDGTVIVWAGMRGVVTLAAAQTLPSDTSHRALLIFVAFMVAVVSLLVQGFTLPGVVRMLRMERQTSAGPSSEEQRRLDDELRTAATAALADPGLKRVDGSSFTPGLVERVGRRMSEPPDDDMTETAKEMLELRLAMIEAMRRRLVDISSYGTFSTPALKHALAELDADQLSLELRIDDEG